MTRKELKQIIKEQFNNLENTEDGTRLLDSGIFKERGVLLFEDRYPVLKRNQKDQIWWVEYFTEQIGRMTFSFDRKKFYEFWGDYPSKLTKEEKTIFDEENPYWKDF